MWSEYPSVLLPMDGLLTHTSSLMSVGKVKCKRHRQVNGLVKTERLAKKTGRTNYTRSSTTRLKTTWNYYSGLLLTSYPSFDKIAKEILALICRISTTLAFNVSYIFTDFVVLSSVLQLIYYTFFFQFKIPLVFCCFALNGQFPHRAHPIQARASIKMHRNPFSLASV